MTSTDDNPNDIFIDMINLQIQKEEEINIWNNSKYKKIIKLQSNNVGIVGETFIQNICDRCDIKAVIDGIKTKKIGGGNGDGIILDKTVEIKTAHQGSKNNSFQHELGEIPWIADIIIFIDISPNFIYLTIFNNFSEEIYKNNIKCKPYFPSKTITWRKKSGAFKLDTTIKINEENIINGYSIKIDDNINFKIIKEFILSRIK
jgi:hypothetical protein